MKILDQSRRFIFNKQVRRILAISILLITIGVIARFFIVHPDYFRQLRHVKPQIIALIIGLNIVMLVTLIGLYDAMLRLCGTQLGIKENLLLTAYSSLVNYFGPLQSGPGLRAVYLKTRHRVRFRDYTLATLITYGFFAFFSGLFLLAGSRPWWQTVGALVIIAVVSYCVIRWFEHRNKTEDTASSFALRKGALLRLAIISFWQVALTAITYYVELKAVSPHIHMSQAITYAGAANFALFVSLTPDAIGFRETFLVLTKHLHHIATSTIISANVIDRGSYLLYLGILFIFVLAIHARDKLQVKRVRSSVKQA